MQNVVRLKNIFRKWKKRYLLGNKVLYELETVGFDSRGSVTIIDGKKKPLHKMANIK